MIKVLNSLKKSLIIRNQIISITVQFLSKSIKRAIIIAVLAFIIKRVNKTKYLGLTIEESLSWNQQYKIVKGKMKGGLNSIRKLREILPQSQLCLVYQALVESHVRYGNLIWGHLPEKKLCALQTIQNRAF